MYMFFIMVYPTQNHYTYVAWCVVKWCQVPRKCIYKVLRILGHSDLNSSLVQ